MTEFLPLPAPSRWRVPLGLALLVLMAVVLVLVFQLALLRPAIVYRIQDRVLEVKGGSGLLGNHRRIKLESLTEITEVTLGRGRRVAGTGMPGFCAGRFSYDGIGSVWQVTDCSRRVLLLRVTGEERPVLLTPPNRAELAQALRDGREGDFSPPPRPQSTGWAAFTTAMPLLMLVLTAYVAAAFFMAPRKLRYRVGSGHLEVQLLLTRREFQLTGARARRHSPGRVWKVAGTALPGYLAGIFSAGGTMTRVYASTSSEEGVLLECKRRVFVTPADVPAFLDALQREGVTLVG